VSTVSTFKTHPPIGTKRARFRQRARRSQFAHLGVYRRARIFFGVFNTIFFSMWAPQFLGAAIGARGLSATASASRGLALHSRLWSRRAWGPSIATGAWRRALHTFYSQLRAPWQGAQIQGRLVTV